MAHEPNVSDEQVQSGGMTTGVIKIGDTDINLDFHERLFGDNTLNLFVRKDHSAELKALLRSHFRYNPSLLKIVAHQLFRPAAHMLIRVEIWGNVEPKDYLELTTHLIHVVANGVYGGIAYNKGTEEWQLHT